MKKRLTGKADIALIILVAIGLIVVNTYSFLKMNMDGIEDYCMLFSIDVIALSIYFISRGKMLRIVVLKDGVIEEYSFGRKVKSVKWDSIVETGIGYQYGEKYIYMSETPTLPSDIKQITHKYIRSEKIIIFPKNQEADEYLEKVAASVSSDTTDHGDLFPRVYKASGYGKRFMVGLYLLEIAGVLTYITEYPKMDAYVMTLLAVGSLPSMFLILYTYAQHTYSVHLSEKKVRVWGLVPFILNKSWDEFTYCNVLTTLTGKPVYISLSTSTLGSSLVPPNFYTRRGTGGVGADCAAAVLRCIVVVPYDDRLFDWIRSNTSLKVKYRVCERQIEGSRTAN